MFVHSQGNLSAPVCMTEVGEEYFEKMGLTHLLGVN